MPRLIINNDELISYTNRLDRLGSNRIPLTVSSTLNNLAFKMKQKEIPASAEKSFDYIRSKSLFRATTGVTKARGMNIRSMRSEAGIIKRGRLSKVSEGLAQQETGGFITKRYKPGIKTRRGKSEAARIARRNYLEYLNPVDAQNATGRNFVLYATRAFNENRIIKVKGFIGRIKSIRRKRNGQIDIKMEWLYRDMKGQLINLKKRPFVKKAYKKTMRTFPNVYIKQAKKYIK